MLLHTGCLSPNLAIGSSRSTHDLALRHSGAASR
jgi:hypothetical protein